MTDKLSPKHEALLERARVLGIDTFGYEVKRARLDNLQKAISRAEDRAAEKELGEPNISLIDEGDRDLFDGLAALGRSLEVAALTLKTAWEDHDRRIQDERNKHGGLGS